jgi:hypothetical protein
MLIEIIVRTLTVRVSLAVGLIVTIMYLTKESSRAD